MPKLNFWVSDNGDGSATTRFEPTAEAARLAEENDKEEFNGGFAEATCDSIEIKIVDGKICYFDSDFKEVDGKYQHVERWIPLED